MPRIRSIHPGLFTDENYAVLSFAARELLKGLWVEADDNGVFEWKPLSIKMRIFPADTVDMPALLAELETAWINRFEADGKSYGACKNFCKYQRPKKPKAVHPLPEEQKAYVRHGYKARAAELDDDETAEIDTGTVPVPYQYPTGTEKSGQMEDGGGKKKEKLLSDPSDFDVWYQAYPRHEGRGLAEKAYRTALKATDAATLLTAAHRFRKLRSTEDPKFTPLPATWLNGQRWLDEPNGTGGDPEPATESGWQDRLRVFRESQLWVSKWGPKPGDPGCHVPKHLILEIARAVA